MADDIVKRLIDESKRPAIREVCVDAANEIMQLRANESALDSNLKVAIAELGLLRDAIDRKNMQVIKAQELAYRLAGELEFKRG